MSRRRHTEAQRIGALRELEAGHKVEDVAQRVGVSKHTIYMWRAKHVSQIREIQRLRDRDARLLKLVADLMLEEEFQSLSSKESPLSRGSMASYAGYK